MSHSSSSPTNSYGHNSNSSQHHNKQFPHHQSVIHEIKSYLNSFFNYFDQTKRNVDMHVVSPIQSIFKDAFKNYPTITSYVMVFSGLSVLPILSFLGFSVFAVSILVGLGMMFVLTWGSIILGSAMMVLLASLGFLAIATFWIVIGSFLALFAFRLLFNLQSITVHRIKDSSIVRELREQAREKKLQQFDQSQAEANEKPQKLMNGQP